MEEAGKLRDQAQEYYSQSLVYRRAADFEHEKYIAVVRMMKVRDELPE